jgi:hypothetical protein
MVPGYQVMDIFIFVVKSYTFLPLSVSLSECPPVCLSDSLSVYACVCLSVFLSSVCLYACLSVCLSVCLSACLSGLYLPSPRIPIAPLLRQRHLESAK